MEHGLVLAGLFLLAITVAQGAIVTPTTCSNKLDCRTGMCCRDANGNILSSPLLGGIGLLDPSGSQDGTCSTRRAQENEICDSICQCETGLTCYRPISGVCCPPMRCYDTEYVEQQREFWANCFKNGNCALPP